jgi:hypothetical protein
MLAEYYSLLFGGGNPIGEGSSRIARCIADLMVHSEMDRWPGNGVTGKDESGT